MNSTMRWNTPAACSRNFHLSLAAATQNVIGSPPTESAQGDRMWRLRGGRGSCRAAFFERASARPEPRPPVSVDMRLPWILGVQSVRRLPPPPVQRTMWPSNLITATWI